MTKTFTRRFRQDQSGATWTEFDPHHVEKPNPAQ